MSLRVLTKAIVVATMLLVVLHFGARDKQPNSAVAMNLAAQFAVNENVTNGSTMPATGTGVNATTMFSNSTSGNATCEHPPDDAAEACLYVQRKVCADESEFIDYLYFHYV